MTCTAYIGAILYGLICSACHMPRVGVIRGVTAILLVRFSTPTLDRFDFLWV